MSERLTRRPPWPMLAAGLMALAYGIARLTRPHDWASLGAFAVVLGALLVALYVDWLARWLRDRA
jgi:energy-converting hydrogenase Eha subunit A